MENKLTESGKKFCIPIPISLPHDAPANNDGTKTPADTLRPVVAIDIM